MIQADQLWVSRRRLKLNEEQLEENIDNIKSIGDQNINNEEQHDGLRNKEQRIQA